MHSFLPSLSHETHVLGYAFIELATDSFKCATACVSCLFIIYVNFSF